MGIEFFRTCSGFTVTANGGCTILGYVELERGVWKYEHTSEGYHLSGDELEAIKNFIERL